MNFPHNDPLFKYRRSGLRKAMPLEESILWNHLKNSKLEGYKFRRQMGIGKYIVDFYCYSCKLVIELDGAQHKDKKDYDQARDNFLASQGCTVVRFWNSEVRYDLRQVLKEISHVLDLLNNNNTTPPCGHPS